MAPETLPDPRPLYRLVYVSHIAPLRSQDLAGTMRDVLLVSHRLNRRDGITGLLVSNGLWIAQALEGAEASVEACYRRISADTRHVLSTVRGRGAVESRLFDRWSMCGMTLSDLDDGLLQPPQTPFNVWTLPGDALLQLLQSVAGRFGDDLDAQHAALGAEVSRRREGRGQGLGAVQAGPVNSVSITTSTASPTPIFVPGAGMP